jgi:hypothetical protein
MGDFEWIYVEDRQENEGRFSDKPGFPGQDSPESFVADPGRELFPVPFFP